MPPKRKEKKTKFLNKLIDFGKKIFAAVLRSRTGAISELARISRFQQGTKGFEREYNRLVPLINKLKDAFREKVIRLMPEKGFRFGIIDDTPVKKSGKKFPKQQKHHDHTSHSFYEGMRVLSSAVYQAGKVATVASKIVGKEDNKLDVAKDDIDMMVTDFLVDVFLFDSWYCKDKVLKHIQEKGKLFVSRTRCDTKVLVECGEVRLDELATAFDHKEYDHIKIHGKSYWVKELLLDLKAYGMLRVILSKDGQYELPIFLLTNSENFSAKFTVKLYLKRFAIEVFFKDAKQFLNFESFMCRKDHKWELHLLLTNVLHWAIQKRNSISKAVRAIRENFQECLLFINENQLIREFFDGVRKKCLT